MSLWRSGFNQCYSLKSNVPLPRKLVRYYGFPRPDIYVRWGKALIETTVIKQLVQTEAPPHQAIEILTSEGAIDLLAFQQGLTKRELFEHISTLAEQDVSHATRYIEQLYAPYLGRIGKISNESCVKSELQTSTRSSSITPTPNEQFSQMVTPQNAAIMPKSSQMDFQSMNLGDDDMNLFDPESWLKESPTAQRLWKDGR